MLRFIGGSFPIYPCPLLSETDFTRSQQGIPLVIMSSVSSFGFPSAAPALEKYGLKFSSGGAHISRTMMLAELGAVLANVPPGSGDADYRDAILQRNVLGKTTDSTRRESLRRLRELYALNEAVPIFGLLRKLKDFDPTSLALLAIQVAWARDPLLRATSQSVVDASEGERVETVSLAQALEAAFPNQYRNKAKTRQHGMPLLRGLSPGTSSVV